MRIGAAGCRILQMGDAASCRVSRQGERAGGPRSGIPSTSLPPSNRIPPSPLRTLRTLREIMETLVFPLVFRFPGRLGAAGSRTSGSSATLVQKVPRRFRGCGILPRRRGRRGARRVGGAQGEESSGLERLKKRYGHVRIEKKVLQ